MFLDKKHSLYIICVIIFTLLLSCVVSAGDVNENNYTVYQDKLSTQESVSVDSYESLQRAVSTASTSGVDEYMINVEKSFNVSSPISWESNATKLVINGNNYQISGNNRFLDVNNNATMLIRNITFNNFNVSSSMIKSSGNLSLESVIIANNTFNSVNTGLIYSTNTLSVTGSSIANTSNVSAFYVENSTALFVNNSFMDNTAQSGGSVTLKYSNATFTTNVFTNNKANSYGGAIYSDSSDLIILNSTFNNNSARVGGAVEFINKTLLRINSSVFTNNTARYDGGAIHTIYPEFIIDLSKFYSNNAGQSGGALAVELIGYNTSQSGLINNSLFENNTAIRNASCLYVVMGNVCVSNSVILSEDVNDFSAPDSVLRLDSNWWGQNNPDFNLRTNNIIPDNWIVMTLTNTTSNTLHVTLNTLNKGNSVNTSIKRNATFTSSTGSLTYHILEVGSADNSYTMGSSNIRVTIDKETLTLGDKQEVYITTRNMTVNQGDVVDLGSLINCNLTGIITITINNQTHNVSINNGEFAYLYNITDNMSGYYNVLFTYNADDYYKSKTTTATIRVISKENTVHITSLKEALINNTTHDIPASYDLRDYNLITPVKDQMSTGSCWAFSTVAILESALLKTTNTEYDFSENTLKNSLNYYAPYGGDALPNSGASALDSVYAAVDWGNIVYEEEDPFDEYSKFSIPIDDSYQIHDVLLIIDEINKTNNTIIKEALMRYGALMVSCYWDSDYYNRFTKAYYNNETNTTNHRVAIIGWDDNYDKSNFKTTPEANGAFIVKNSWGIESGDEGYEYISYYDTSLQSVYAILVNTTQQYDNSYQYEHVSIAYIRYDTANTTYKNVYNATKHESIATVATYLYNPSNYTVEINVNGKLKYNQTGSLLDVGYRTIRLDEYVELYEGDNFEIILTIASLTNTSNLVPLWSPLFNGYRNSLVENRSFVLVETGWADLTQINATACLRAYTINTPEIETSIDFDLSQITTKLVNTNPNGTIRYLINGEYLRDISNNIVEVNVNDNMAVLHYKLNVSRDTNFNLTTEYLTSYYDTIQTNNFIKNSKYLVELTTSNAEIGKSINIEGILRNETNIVRNAIISIYINNEKIKEVQTDNEGYYYFNYTPESLTINNKVEAIYELDGENYTNTTYFNVTKINTILQVNATNTVILSNTQITIKLTDTYNNPLENKYILIYNNGFLISTQQTNTNGAITLQYTTNLTGNNIITVFFAGDPDYESTITSKNYNVSRINNTITVTSLRLYDEDIIILYGNILTDNTTGVPNRSIQIVVNSYMYANTTTDDNGDFTYSYKIHRDEENVVALSIDETEYYTSSETVSRFTIPRINNTIQITSVYLYDDDIITVYGKVSLDNNTGISNRQVSILINHYETTNTTTDNEGLFNISFKINRERQYVIYASINQTDLYTQAETVTQFTINKTSTNLSVNITNNTSGEIHKIRGLLTGDEKTIGSANITIRINGEKIATIITNNDGVFEYNYTSTRVGTNILTVSYEESDTYKSASTTKTFTTYKITTKTTLTIGQVYVGENTLTGTLTDTNNKAITNAVITIKINNITLLSVTNNTGGFTSTYQVNNSGLQIITAIYNGNGTYQNSTTTKSTNASKINAKITLNTIKAKVNDTITLRATIKDANNNNVDGGVVTFRVNGKTLILNNKTINAIVTGGVAEVNITVPTTWYTNKSNISAVYSGNYKVNNITSSNTPLNITLRSASIQLLADAGPFKAGETIKLRIIVHEGSTLVSNGRVTFKFNGITLKDSKGNAIQANVKNGVGEITWTIPDGTTAYNYNLTGVFGGGIYERFEQSTTLTIAKVATHINASVYTTNTNKIQVTATILDGNNKPETGSSRISIKIAGLTIASSVTINNGKIDVTSNLNLKSGLYPVEIIAGENSAYEGTRIRTYVIRT